MNRPFTILGIAGSLRKQSYNRAALRAAQQLAPGETRVETFELDGIPLFNQDDEQHPPDKVTSLKSRVRGRTQFCWSLRNTTTRFRAC
jgi:chromate reductase